MCIWSGVEFHLGASGSVVSAGLVLASIWVPELADWYLKIALPKLAGVALARWLPTFPWAIASLALSDALINVYRWSRRAAIFQRAGQVKMSFAYGELAEWTDRALIWYGLRMPSPRQC
jgi:hypothetical protein